MITACAVAMTHVELVHDFDDIGGNNHRANEQHSRRHNEMRPGEVAEKRQCMNARNERSLQHQDQHVSRQPAWCRLDRSA